MSEDNEITEHVPADSQSLHIANYAVAFLDLQGQREMYAGEALLPNDQKDLENLLAKARLTVGAIARMREITHRFMNGARQVRAPDFDNFSDDQKRVYEQLRRENLTVQNLSDGIVLFQTLNEVEFKVPLRGIFFLMACAGSLCMSCLALRQPLRGGIEVAWAMELGPGDLHGCALVRAYELESKIAEFPRIVLGEYLMAYLRLNSLQHSDDIYGSLNKSIAESCLQMTAKDTDGKYFLDYLGEGFEEHVFKGEVVEEKQLACEFVVESLTKFEQCGDIKLAGRYRRLLDYYLRSGLTPNKG